MRVKYSKGGPHVRIFIHESYINSPFALIFSSPHLMFICCYARPVVILTTFNRSRYKSVIIHGLVGFEWRINRLCCGRDSIKSGYMLQKACYFVGWMMLCVVSGSEFSRNAICDCVLRVFYSLSLDTHCCLRFCVQTNDISVSPIIQFSTQNISLFWLEQKSFSYYFQVTASNFLIYVFQIKIIPSFLSHMKIRN